jgi:cyclopropane-fatty-acyl-phospholipid synthase
MSDGADITAGGADPARHGFAGPFGERAARPLGWLARRTLERVAAAWTVGRLTIHLPDGKNLTAGSGAAEPHATMWIEDAALFRKYLWRGDLGAAESYMNGDWRTDDIARFLELAVRNAAAVPLDTGLTKIINTGKTLAHRLRVNTRTGSRRNISRHYDLSNDFFSLFLDDTLTYSCAVFDAPDQDLSIAHTNKFQRLCDRLDIGARDHVLEIGCGWGSFAMFAAATRGCRVTALTISERQRTLAAQRVQAAGLSDRVDVRLCDYRDIHGRYDKIVSIEMLEAVGREYWDRFFQKCDEVLAPNGLIGLQTITVPDHRFDTYARHGDWIQVYIFPGGLLPSLLELCRAAYRSTKLTIRHLDDIGEHYATTLARWRQAFVANLAEVRALGFDDRFIRMWEYYLAYCEAGFRTKMLGDLQIVMGRTL